ncbi:MAG: hypothetical protein P8L78_03690 [Mariniblastus sp.]|nr:hypothetical protein [Mariniblastus sp.]
MLIPNLDETALPAAAAESSPDLANEEKRGKLLRRALRASLLDGAAFGGMVGFGETYLPAFGYCEVTSS